VGTSHKHNPSSHKHNPELVDIRHSQMVHMPNSHKLVVTRSNPVPHKLVAMHSNLAAPKPAGTHHNHKLVVTHTNRVCPKLVATHKDSTQDSMANKVP
jgi:hypothetical protein